MNYSDGMLPTVLTQPPPVRHPEPYPGQQEDAKVFFVDILAAIYRRWRLALAVGGTVTAAAMLLTISLTPLYTSVATLVIEPRQQQAVITEAALSGLPADSSVVDTEVEILRSPELALRIVQDLELESDPEFNAALVQPNVIDRAVASIRRTVGRWFDNSETTLASNAAMFGLGDPPLRLNDGIGSIVGTSSPVSGDRTRQAAANGFRSQLEVTRVGLTYAIRIMFSSADPEKAQRIANAVMETYLEQQVELKENAIQRANALIASRVDSLRDQLNGAERAIAEYTDENSLFNAVGSNLTEQGITALLSELANAEADQAEKEARLAAALDQSEWGGAAALGEAVESDTVRILRQQQAEVLRERANLETRFGARHPEVINIRRQASDLEDAIQSEINRIVGSIRANVVAARQRTDSIRNSIARERETLRANNSAGVGLAELERNAESVRTVYEAFLTRLRQTNEQQGMEVTDARIVAAAMLPLAPSYPPRSLAMIAALCLGFFAALATIVLAELRDDRIKSADEAEQAFGLPVLAAIPSVRHRNPAEYVVEKPLSHFAESLRNLEAALFLSNPNVKPKMVTFVSPVPREGKTTCTLAIARLCSMSGARVAIVDADTRRRTLSHQLKLANKPGLLEVLSGSASLEECMSEDRVSSAMVLPAGTAELAKNDLLQTPVTKSLFDRLRSKYDIVFIDTAPLLAVSDARFVARHADAAVVLTRWHQTPRGATAEAIRVVRSINVPVVGLALTQVNKRRHSSFAYSPHSYKYQRAYLSYYRG